MGMWWSQGRDQPARHVVEAVVAAFNARDFTAVYAHLLPDFTMIDSMGASVRGRNEVVSLLRKLVACDPQFLMHVEEITSHGEHILLSGHTTGSHQLSLQQRTLWKIQMRNGCIAEWHTYSAEVSRPFIGSLTGQGEHQPCLAASPHAT